ncbi:MAG: aldo/keto reductase, partial [Desulfobacterales bacterium]
MAETVGAMADIVHEGKVRYLGLSNVTSDQVRQARRDGIEGMLLV